jgi:hypothetical protein
VNAQAFMKEQEEADTSTRMIKLLCRVDAYCLPRSSIDVHVSSMNNIDSSIRFLTSNISQEWRRRSVPTTGVIEIVRASTMMVRRGRRLYGMRQWWCTIMMTNRQWHCASSSACCDRITNDRFNIPSQSRSRYLRPARPGAPCTL